MVRFEFLLTSVACVNTVLDTSWCVKSVCRTVTVLEMLRVNCKCSVLAYTEAITGVSLLLLSVVHVITAAVDNCIFDSLTGYSRSLSVSVVDVSSCFVEFHLRVNNMKLFLIVVLL